MTDLPKIASAPLNTKYGASTLHVFSWSENEQDNVLALIPTAKAEVPTVRIQSACYSGEIFESLDCDCHWQLETSLNEIHNVGGIFIYMLKDGRGAGLLTKLRGMDLSARFSIDTAEAYDQLGVPRDPRNYEQAAFVLNHFNVSKLRLLTNNPRKIAALVAHGFVVERDGLESKPTDYNRDYLRSKALKLGHLMQTFGTDGPPE